MRTIAPYVLVKLDWMGHRVKVVGGVQIELQKQYGFDKRHSNVDRGWVVAVNDGEKTIQVDDYVIFHFHTFAESNAVYLDGDVYYKVQSSNIFCIVNPDNSLVALNSYIFSNIIPKQPKISRLMDLGHVDRGVYQDRSVIKYIPEGVKHLKPGQLIYHIKNTHYDVELPNGDVYYRVREKEICGYED